MQFLPTANNVVLLLDVIDQPNKGNFYLLDSIISLNLISFHCHYSCN